MSEGKYSLSIDQIQKYLPHRPPFLLIDRILEIQPVGDLNDPNPSSKIGTKVVGIKNVSFNEPFFTGHFPGFAIMPGVLLIESMAQTASFSLYPYIEQDASKFNREFQCILVGVEHARFRRQVTPGDTVRIESTVTKCRGRLWAFHTEAFVQGQIVAEADLLANLMPGAKG